MRTLIPVFAVLSVAAGALLPYAYLANPLPVYYQSQDTRAGVHSYSYAGGPSAKEETRGPDGITRGSYSYIDANGYLQSVFYVADEDGFRVAATNLPSNDGSLPYDTSDILLARAARSGSAAREARNRDESPSPAGRGKRSPSDAPTPPSDDDGPLDKVSERPMCRELLQLLDFAAETRKRETRSSASLRKRSLDMFAATNPPLSKFEYLCKEFTRLLLQDLSAHEEQREESLSVSRRTYPLEVTNSRYVTENALEQPGKLRLWPEQKFREDEQELREMEQRYREQENMEPNWPENLRFYRAKRSLDAPDQDRQASSGDPSPRRDQPDQDPAIASKSSHGVPAPEETAGEGRALVAPVYGLLDSVLIPRLIGTTAASQQSRVDVHSNVRLEAVQPAEAIVQPVPAEPTVLLSGQVPPAGSQQQLQVQNGLRVDALRKDAAQSLPLVRLEPILFVLPDYNENRIQLHKNLGLEGPDRKDAVKIDAARLAIVEETAVAAVPVVKEAPLTIATAVSSQNRVQTHNSAKVEAEAPVGPAQYVAASYAQPIALPIWPAVAPSSQTYQTRSSEKIESAN